MKVTCHYRNDPERGLTDPLPDVGGRRFVLRIYSGDVCFPLLGTAFGEKWFEPPFPRYVGQGGGWRFTIANWVCNNLLDVFDPSGNHC